MGRPAGRLTIFGGALLTAAADFIHSAHRFRRLGGKKETRKKSQFTPPTTCISHESLEQKIKKK